MDEIVSQAKENYSFLTTPKQILVSLLTSRLCTPDQIHKCFGYATPNAAAVTLKRLKKEGLIDCSARENHNGVGSVYNLTNKGSEVALTSLGISPYELTGDNKLVSNFNTQGELRLKSRIIPHEVSITDIYYTLHKFCGYRNFSWIYSGESEIVSVDQKAKVRGDSSFIVNDVKYYIEQDMNTESKSVLQKKFTNYAQALYEKTEMPILLFSINLDYTISTHEKGMYFKRLERDKEELTSLKSKLNNMDPPKLDSVSSDEFRKQIEKMNDFLCFATKQQKNYFTFLDNSQTGSVQSKYDDISNNGYTRLKNLYESKKCEFERKRTELLDKVLSKNYRARENTVKGILLTIDKKVSHKYSIYHRLLDGLDIYVNNHCMTQEYIEKHVTKSELPIDIVSDLYLSNLKSQIAGDADRQAVLSVKFSLLHNHSTFVVDRFIQVHNRKSPNYYCGIFFDISYNNLGSYVRLTHMIREFKRPFDKIIDFVIVVVVDDENQASVISQETDYYRLSEHFQYIDVSNFQELSRSGIILTNLDIYRIINGKKSYVLK